MVFKCRPGVAVIYKQEHGREILPKGKSGLFNCLKQFQTILSFALNCAVIQQLWI